MMMGTVFLDNVLASTRFRISAGIEPCPPSLNGLPRKMRRTGLLPKVSSMYFVYVPSVANILPLTNKWSNASRNLKWSQYSMIQNRNNVAAANMLLIKSKTPSDRFQQVSWLEAMFITCSGKKECFVMSISQDGQGPQSKNGI